VKLKTVHRESRSIHS